MDYIEHVTTPLNACSLETERPVQLQNGEFVWPLMLGCYQLDESTGYREGHLDLYAVPVPSSEDEGDDTKILGLGKPMSVYDINSPPDSTFQPSGILDGKFCPAESDQENRNHRTLVFATAHATGEIQLHSIQTAKENEENAFEVNHIGRTDATGDGLCLSLSWDLSSNNGVSPNNPRRIVSSYSDGRVSVHQIGFTSSGEETTMVASVEEVLSWSAHKMFRSPAEVWCASFTTQDQVVLSGGDEGKLKIWDLRIGPAAPVHSLQYFDAGVTVLSPHPRREHIVACGSYDETMALLDLRTISEGKPRKLCHSTSLGGGIWRMKWHPECDDRLLVGAMHGGCRIVDLDHEGGQSLDVKVSVKQEFTNHKSMAYGADWLVKKKARGLLIEAAASCSFYDQALYLWNVKR